MELVLDITDDMAKILDEAAKRSLISREDVAKAALSAWAIKGDKEFKIFGLNLDALAKIFSAVSDGLIETSDQYAKTKL